MNAPLNETGGLTTDLAERIKIVRMELYGEGEFGQELLAGQLDIPVQTWANYEAGVKMPARIMLDFLDRTGVRPGWLLNGRGQRFLDD